MGFYARFLVCLLLEEKQDCRNCFRVLSRFSAVTSPDFDASPAKVAFQIPSDLFSDRKWSLASCRPAGGRLWVVTSVSVVQDSATLTTSVTVPFPNSLGLLKASLTFCILEEPRTASPSVTSLFGTALYWHQQKYVFGTRYQHNENSLALPTRELWHQKGWGTHCYRILIFHAYKPAKHIWRSLSIKSYCYIITHELEKNPLKHKGNLPCYTLSHYNLLKWQEPDCCSWNLTVWEANIVSG